MEGSSSRHQQAASSTSATAAAAASSSSSSNLPHQHTSHTTIPTTSAATATTATTTTSKHHSHHTISQLPMATRKKLSRLRAQIKRQASLKQKLVALLKKKFRTDGSDFDSEEQYREALERELMKAAAGRGSKAIEELLEDDIDDVEEESNSEQEDWDNISDSSTPKPSLRPFFSSTTLDKI